MSVNEEVDVLRLYAGTLRGFHDDEFSTAHQKWNNWLKDCFAHNQFDLLIAVRRGIQIGISNVQRKGLMTEDIAAMYCRWIGSIDKTIRRIIKNRQTTGNDFIDKTFHSADNLKTKRERDVALEEYLKRMSY